MGLSASDSAVLLVVPYVLSPAVKRAVITELLHRWKKLSEQYFTRSRRMILVFNLISSVFPLSGFKVLFSSDSKIRAIFVWMDVSISGSMHDWPSTSL